MLIFFLLGGALLTTSLPIIGLILGIILITMGLILDDKYIDYGWVFSKNKFR